MIEVTPEKKVVWTFADHKTMRTISSVQVLDVPGDATKGQIAHQRLTPAASVLT